MGSTHTMLPRHASGITISGSPFHKPPVRLATSGCTYFAAHGRVEVKHDTYFPPPAFSPMYFLPTFYLLLTHLRTFYILFTYFLPTFDLLFKYFLPTFYLLFFYFSTFHTFDLLSYFLCTFDLLFTYFQNWPNMLPTFSLLSIYFLPTFYLLLTYFLLLFTYFF